MAGHETCTGYTPKRLGGRKDREREKSRRRRRPESNLILAGKGSAKGIRELGKQRRKDIGR